MEKENKEVVICFDTDDFYIEFEDGEVEYEYEFYIEEKQDFIDFVKNNTSDQLVLSGEAGLWNGNHSYTFQILTIDEFFNKMSDDIEHIKAQITKNSFDQYDIEIWGTHHDGTNYYNLTPIEFYDKSELIEKVLEGADEDWIRNVLLYDLTDKEPPVDCSHDELIEFVEEELSDIDNEELVEYIQ